MFIKFESNGSAPFIMQSGIAQQLVSMMGQGTGIDGSISGPAILEAISKLKEALAQQSEAEVSMSNEVKREALPQDEEIEPLLPLNARAVPLMKMLHSAKAVDSFVMWRSE
jgi:hypothetical protein|tara:strand:- start:998 stop:1330 length:333 start_codon:yes stop_codon:yes gene_type:complete